MNKTKGVRKSENNGWTWDVNIVKMSTLLRKQNWISHVKTNNLTIKIGTVSFLMAFDFMQELYQLYNKY